MKLSCFGIPSVFNFKSNVCKACSDFEQCQSESHAQLISVESKLWVTDLLAEHETYTISKKKEKPRVIVSDALPIQRKTKVLRVQNAIPPEVQSRLDTLPVKASTHARRIIEKGFDKTIMSALMIGANPFNGNQMYLSVAIDLLLSGGFTKASLRTAYINQLGWSEGTAFSHVSIVWHLFPFFDFAQARGAYMVPGPCVGTQNNQIMKFA